MNERRIVSVERRIVDVSLTTAAAISARKCELQSGCCWSCVASRENGAAKINKREKLTTVT